VFSTASTEARDALSTELRAEAAARARLLAPLVAPGDVAFGRRTALHAACRARLHDVVAAWLADARCTADVVSQRDALNSLVGELRASCAAESRKVPAGSNVAAIAGVNSPQQIVISGHIAALERAVEAYGARAVDAAGAARRPPIRKTMRLPVGAPFHCPIMEPAAHSLRSIGLCDPASSGVHFADFRSNSTEPWDLEFEAAAAAALRLCAPRAPVVSNADASLHSDAGEIRSRLAESVTRPVLWAESVFAAHAAGARHFLELGPGSALAGLVRHTLPSVSVFSVGTTENLRSYLAFLRAELSHE
jgi:[acyl-carrier-protein] S-malonyltransferase